MPLVPDPKNCDISVKRAIQLLSKKLGYTATPDFKSITLSDLVASRLVATGSGKVFESVTDLTNWIVGTENQVIVTILAGGKVTLSTPQNTHTDAEPEFAGMVIKNGADYTIFYVDNNEMYFTAIADIVTGNPIGLLLTLTYTV